jgi:hypothetical protein
MRCIIFYAPILITNVKTQTRKGLILYSGANGIIALKNHVYVNHCMIANLKKKKVNNILKKLMRKNLQKNRLHVNKTIIYNVFATKHFYKKNDV